MTERGRGYLAALRAKPVLASPAPHSRTAMKEEAVRGSAELSEIPAASAGMTERGRGYLAALRTKPVPAPPPRRPPPPPTNAIH